MPSLKRMPAGLLEVLLAITAARSCQRGLRQVHQQDGGDARQLQLLPAKAGCQCGPPTLYMLVGGDGAPCDRREPRDLNSPVWLRVQDEHLTLNQTVDVYFAGWYGARSDRCPKGARLWVDGLSAAAWNVSMSAKLEQTDGETHCLGVQVIDQWDTSTALGLTFPWLTLCLKEVGVTGVERDPWRECRTVEFPQRSAERLCWPRCDLPCADKYVLTVSPHVATLCREYLPGCPYRSRVLSVPQLLGPVTMGNSLPAADASATDSGSLATYCVGAIAVVVVVVAAALFVRRQKLRSEDGRASKKTLYLYLREAKLPLRTDPSDPTSCCELTSQI